MLVGIAQRAVVTLVRGKRRVGVLVTARTAFGSGFARSVFWIALGILGLPLAMPRWVLFHDYQLPAHRRDNQPAR
jgi:hypothetical protein